MGLFNKQNKSEQKENNDVSALSDDEYSPVDVDVFHADEGYDFIYDYSTKTTHRVHPSMTGVLQQITGFASIDEHVDSLMQKGWNPQSYDLVMRCFDELNDAGLIRSKSNALEKIKKHAVPSDGSDAITSAAWITCDRSDSLMMSMESFIASHKKYGHAPAYKVCDDSVSADACTHNKARLAELAGRHAIDIRYAGIEEKKSFRDALVAETKVDGVSPEIIDFALFGDKSFGPTHGANRNAVLLSTIGEMFTSADDDVFCRIAEPLEKKSGLACAELFTSDEMFPYKDRDSVLAAHPETECDLFAKHSKLLGKNAADIFSLKEFEKQISLSHVTPQMLRMLEDGKAKVRATIAGVSGDSGMYTPRYIFRAKDKTRENLVSSHEMFASAFECREIYQSSGSFALASSTYFPGMHVGLDNRDILPPFMPVFRGEDTIYSMMLRYVHSDTLYGVLPQAIYHNPQTQRLFDKEEIFNVQPVFCDLMNFNIYWFGLTQRSTEAPERMKRLGMHLMEIGTLSNTDFEELMRLRWMSWAGNVIKDIESIIQQHDAQPEYWVDALMKYVHALSLYAEKGSFAVPKDLSNSRSGDITADAAKKFFFQYGKLLLNWNMIYEAAKRCNTRGQHIIKKPA
jgi:hypothetical protein